MINQSARDEHSNRIQLTEKVFLVEGELEAPIEVTKSVLCTQLRFV